MDCQKARRTADVVTRIDLIKPFRAKTKLRSKMLLQNRFGNIRVVKNFREQSTSNVFPGMNRHDCGATIPTPQIVVTALETDDRKSHAF